MFQVNFKEIEDGKELELLRKYLLSHNEFYPIDQYNEWINEKCIPRINSGEYKPIIAISERSLVGNLIYRPLPLRRIEIKSLRVSREKRGRDLGHFMLVQIEKDNPASVFTTDVTASNSPTVSFFLRNGYQVTSKENLYLPNQIEYILEKHPQSK